jgi:iron complex transport system ATP-binding protein
MDDLIFQLRGLGYRYASASAPVLDGVDLSLGRREFLAVVGPNGSGKTTLLRLLLGLLRPASGQVLVEGRPAQDWDRRALARLVGVVAQREEPAFPLKVRDAVSLGRYPHVGALGALRAEDRRAVEQALARCDATQLADRWVGTLSGGEWQRVRAARALAQSPSALVLDEPTANLDVAHEMELFELVAELVRGDGLAGLMITHHVNLAARYADRLAILHRGRVAASGPPASVMRREVLEPVFGWPLEVTRWRAGPQFVPLKRSEVNP